ncbi:hypothetical protein E2C01_098384 [Portunus trituberculatus]|uniref:Uncharacterized protein n=1 Tax=Portunus trituberculatus TaxID=210409 RepID=A0A5B7K6V7_PORTR|nr:hypothetical protein [Portunus trituberculatus]
MCFWVEAFKRNRRSEVSGGAVGEEYPARRNRVKEEGVYSGGWGSRGCKGCGVLVRGISQDVQRIGVRKSSRLGGSWRSAECWVLLGTWMLREDSVYLRHNGVVDGLELLPRNPKWHWKQALVRILIRREDKEEVMREAAISLVVYINVK